VYAGPAVWFDDLTPCGGARIDETARILRGDVGWRAGGRVTVVGTGVRDYVNGLASPERRRDAETLIELMRRCTGEEPTMWGSIVGFGRYHYRYASGREGDAPAASFAVRKAATSVYVMDGVAAHADLLERLGPHKTGVGCIYLKDLATIDVDVLESIVARSSAALTAGTYTARAREGGRGSTPDT
jgi:hypothetical protein